MNDRETVPTMRRRDNWRFVAAILVALAAAFAVYMMAEAGAGGAIGYALMVVLPAALSAFIAWAGSIGRRWSRGTFLAVPLWLAFAATAIGAIVLREGVVCLVMVLPFWVGFGYLGIWPVYLYRRSRWSVDPATFRAHALLLLPFLALLVDQQVAPPRETRTVVREIIVDAPAAAVWPRLLAIPAIAPDEGRWNISQDLLRLPRPVAAHLTGEGPGAVRDARWQDDIRFQEIVTGWRPGEALQWRFAFPDPSIHQRTDRHIEPHGRHLWIDSGGYRLIPLAGGRTRIRLWTRYHLATPFNAYAGWWGERILGDIQDNVLSVVAGRIENRTRGETP
ncbi:SRPBCC family protein [Sphingopyxis sp.]|uniref:SRPBCC family protein n=1 Tax=Sphingopyxis sp. TaxID=1908224 RepID=UPI002B4A7140|nr:SRPBCC family protein [Sphingopyxis sp.]HJS12171.1 SRPBCC family protein [Sphingopyxis sp.]